MPALDWTGSWNVALSHGTVWNLLPKEAEDLSTRCLIRAAHGDPPCYNNENVESDAGYGDTEDDRRGGDVDTPKVFGQSPAEQQERDLQHQRREATRLAHRAWDLDERVRRTCPLWDCRNAATGSGTVHCVNKDAKESSRLVVRVLLELGMDLDDERGGYGREGTSPQLVEAASRQQHSKRQDDAL